ncbi:MAG: hypothetical protein KY442_02545 [Proteobacteria bacterium]|nr:hypothetical protein [Pseudomonadota bacterium]
MSQIRKQLVSFGPDRRLTGVLTRGTARSGGPTLVLPSAGLQPRSGPFRLHVALGERLAEHGVASFRFDVPGVGEAPRLKGCDGRDAALAALEVLATEHDCSDFVVGGVCSAADLGWNVALRDARVRAVLMLDGIGFTGPWFHYARTLDRLRRLPREWRRMLRDAPKHLRDSEGFEATDVRDWPSHAQARQQFADLVDRGVHQMWIYTGGYTDRFLHPRQFRWAFGEPAGNPRVAMRYWPDCDHTFFARAHRDRLLGTVEEWMLKLANTLTPNAEDCREPATSSQR